MSTGGEWSTLKELAEIEVVGETVEEQCYLSLIQKTESVEEVVLSGVVVVEEVAVVVEVVAAAVVFEIVVLVLLMCIHLVAENLFLYQVR